MARIDVKEELERLRKALSAHSRCVIALMLRTEKLENAILSALNQKLQTGFENPGKYDIMLSL
jgi:hypothetical protein